MNKYRTLCKALNRLKDENPNVKLVKVYYIDDENFTIKGIDENGEKVFTKRIQKDKKLSGFDCNFREKQLWDMLSITFMYQ